MNGHFEDLPYDILERLIAVDVVRHAGVVAAWRLAAVCRWWRTAARSPAMARQYNEVCAVRAAERYAFAVRLNLSAQPKCFVYVDGDDAVRELYRQMSGLVPPPPVAVRARINLPCDVWPGQLDAPGRTAVAYVCPLREALRDIMHRFGGTVIIANALPRDERAPTRVGDDGFGAGGTVGKGTWLRAFDAPGAEKATAVVCFRRDGEAPPLPLTKLPAHHPSVRVVLEVVFHRRRRRRDATEI